MPLTWKSVEPEHTTCVWDEVANTAKGATFFHTRSWANILQTTFPHWQPATIGIVFSNGNQAVVPQMKRQLLPLDRSDLFSYRESMLPGVYGGPLFLHEPGEEWAAIWNEVNKFPNMVMLGNPYLEYSSAPKISQRLATTRALDLTPGYTQIRNGFHKRYRTYVNSALKQGVEIAVAQTGHEIDSYYAVYQKSLERWGKEASGFYPKRLFTNLFTQPDYNTRIKLWVSHFGGNIIAGAWVFYHQKHAAYWHGATDTTYSRLRPMHALMAAAIEDACANGYDCFDFNPSGGSEGVDQFKAGFGAQQIDFHIYRRLTPVGRSFRAYRYFTERYLRRCPL